MIDIQYGEHGDAVSVFLFVVVRFCTSTDIVTTRNKYNNIPGSHSSSKWYCQEKYNSQAFWFLSWIFSTGRTKRNRV